MIAVKVLPADHADVQDIAYYRDRLEDPSLIDAGVVVVMGPERHLAVPIGGRRRGGCIPVPTIRSGLAVRRALVDRRGFPALRVRWSVYPDTCHVVEWGEALPTTYDDAVRGRFYGYTPRAVARFIQEG
ncbi:DUF6302 family protein [Streptomyces sp. NPDC028722]|uniref:DUF6302 family protein n=1 Tax=Streptomyces sp. NPDC028722 TaxID=3155016 RepID=UPI0033F433E5